MRFLLIDRVLEFEIDKRIIVIKNVTLESDVMEHHFPNLPLFPGTLMLEAMAQAAGYLLMRTSRELDGTNTVAFLSSVRQAHFHQPVYPGDQIKITACLENRVSSAAFFSIKAEVQGKNKARAQLVLVQTVVNPQKQPEVAASMDQFLKNVQTGEF